MRRRHNGQLKKLSLARRRHQASRHFQKKMLNPIIEEVKKRGEKNA